MDNNAKHVLITGGTRGIGLGLAVNFLKQDCDVTISGLNEKRLKETLSTLKKDYPNRDIYGFVSDITNRKEVEKLFTNAVEAVGSIDIWVNNAGRGQEMEYAWDLESEMYANIISTNITGMIHGSLTAMTHMIKQGFGKIYNMEGFGSDGMIRSKMTLYGTTKRAVRYFTRSLAKEAGETNVKVGTISPGMVITDFIMKPLEKQSIEEQEKTRKIFNILADRVETVTPFLVDQMLKNNKNNARIEWLTKPKIMWRFITSSLIKRDVFTSIGQVDV